jgi:hypothetical protein
VTLHRLSCVIILFEDGSAAYRFELNRGLISNQLPGAEKYRDMLQLLNPSQCALASLCVCLCGCVESIPQCKVYTLRYHC